MATTTDPIERAKQGDVEYFKGVKLDVIQKSKDKEGTSVFAIAAMYGHLNCTELIYRRCPQLLYERNNGQFTTLHHAAYNGRDEVVTFLLTANAKLEQEMEGIKSGGEPIVDQKLLMMVSAGNDTALHSAALQGRHQSAKLLIEADSSNTLLRMVLKYGKETALHLAVREKHLEVVKVLVEADPDFEYSVDAFGHTPLFIALQDAFSGNQKAVEIRNFLIQRQSSQCAVRTGMNGWTLLHHATFKGDLSAIEEIIRSNLGCSELVDNEGRNFLHLATKFEHESIVKYVLGLVNISYNVLNGQDSNGNTPLHIATAKTSVNIALSLLYDHRVNKLIQNKQGNNALAAIRFEYDKRRAGVLGLIDSVDEKDLKDRSDFDLLVGALISTVSFTAGITVPGGFNSDGREKGIAILHKKGTFVAFIVFNTIALALSLFAVFIHFCLRHQVDEKEITFQLKVATICSIGAIFGMMVAFIMGSLAVLSASLSLILIVCGICSIFFGCAFYFLWRMIRQQRRRRLV